MSVTSSEEDDPPVTVGLTFPLPMAAPAIPPPPPPLIGGTAAIPPAPVVTEVPEQPVSPPSSPPDLSDDSISEENLRSDSDPHMVPVPASQSRPPNEFIRRQTERAVRAKERSNQLDFSFLKSKPQSNADASPSGLPKQSSRKREIILDSCARNRPGTNETPTGQNLFQNSQSPQTRSPQQILADQRAIRSKYSLRNLQKRLSSNPNSNNVNSLIDTTVTPIFRFCSGNILDSSTSIAHCVSSDFAMRKGLASAIACCYPALQNLRSKSFQHVPPGALVVYYDTSRKRFIYNLVTKRKFFHKTML